MSRGQRYIVHGQKTVTRGSAEPEFQGDNIWAGIYEDIHEQDPYFYSYSHFGIHEEMIKDSVRTDTYMNAIIDNPHLFQGKVVLDIGCGTGILSIFASRAGASHVFGIDAADVAYKAQEIIRDNGLGDKITIIKGKVEEVELPVDKVDIIISEWMGYFLLYESMLDTVIYARDKWLAADGLMFPDTATHWYAAIEDAEYKENKVGFWDSVYGFNMSAMKPLVMSEPIVDYVESQAVVTSECKLFTMDLKTVKIEDLEFSAVYSLTATRNDYVHAMVNWFEVEFNHGNTPIKISTSPSRKTTHWKQTVFYLDDVLPMNSGEELKGSIAVRRNPEHPRDIDIKISYHFDGSKHSYHDVRFYKLK